MTQQFGSPQLQKQISYEIFTEFNTRQSLTEVQQVLLRQVQSIAEYVTTYPDGIIGICKIAAGTGAINREDAAFYQLQPIGNGYRCIVSVIYKPSIFFWIFLFLGLGTVILGILHIYLYDSQKKTVRNAIERSLMHVKHELETGYQG